MEYKTQYVVMSGGTSFARAFATNHVTHDSEDAAKVAVERNKVERKAGRNKSAVLWFVSENSPEMQKMMASFKK